jgi:hypothetical protein
MVQLAALQVDPIAQPYWALENATASVVEVGANAGAGGGVGSGDGDSNWLSGIGDSEVAGTTVGLASGDEQPASNPTAATPANHAILCTTGERRAARAVIVRRYSRKAPSLGLSDDRFR